MGKFFRMSMRFGKSSPEDFSLVPLDSQTAMDPDDRTLWVKASLYDFGWGKENGFWKAPLPDFDTLVELALSSPDWEDRYGAAAILLDRFPEALLARCEQLLPTRPGDFQKLAELLNLKSPVNRSPVAGKTLEQIQADHQKWIALAKAAEEPERLFPPERRTP